jgi:hypothetical protein
LDYTTILSGIELPCQQSCSIDPQSLYAAFEQVPDGRDKQGKQYPLALLLTLLMLAKLAGETSVSGAAHWLRLRRDWLCRTLQLSRDRLPCQGTYYYALRKVQAEHVQAAVQQFLASLPKSQTQREPTLRQLAMDGKTLHGTLGHDHPAQEPVHLLAVYDVQAGRVLAQQQVHKKQNEISVAPQLLKQIQVEDCLLSSDALHTQRKWCRNVDQHQGKYMVIAKDNQRELRQDEYTTLAFFSLLCYTSEEGQKDLVSPGGTEMMSFQRARLRNESRCPSPPRREPRTSNCTRAS